MLLEVQKRLPMLVQWLRVQANRTAFEGRAPASTSKSPGPAPSEWPSGNQMTSRDLSRLSTSSFTKAAAKSKDHGMRYPAFTCLSSVVHPGFRIANRPGVELPVGAFTRSTSRSNRRRGAAGRLGPLLPRGKHHVRHGNREQACRRTPIERTELPAVGCSQPKCDYRRRCWRLVWSTMRRPEPYQSRRICRIEIRNI
jgi:hypothetical protein